MPFVLCIDETGDRKKGKTTDYAAQCTAIPKGSRNSYPLARLLGIHPSGLACHVLQGASDLLRMSPCVGWFERQHIGRFQGA
jgi:hypothetical protein